MIHLLDGEVGGRRKRESAVMGVSAGRLSCDGWRYGAPSTTSVTQSRSRTLRSERLISGSGAKVRKLSPQKKVMFNAH